MTVAELIRAIKSYNRRTILASKERASFDYLLADLIGRSIARVYSSSAKMPTLAEHYPSLFESEELEEAKQQKKDELSAIRFRQFAEAHNKKFKGGENEK